MNRSVKFYKSNNKSWGWFFVLVLLFSFTSCIQTKKIVYLTNETTLKVEETPVPYNYKIQIGDRFAIKVTDPLAQISLGEGNVKSNDGQNQNVNGLFQQPSLNDLLVNKDGTIDLPMVGSMHVVGIFLQDLRDSILSNYKGYISNPSVKIFMTNYNVTVLGDVNRPGFFQVITNEPNFFDAVALAGGLTDFSDRSKVQIIRKVDGKVISEFIDITDPAFITSPFYYIMPNDIINVRPLKSKKYSVGNSFPLILSTIGTLFTIFALSRTF